MLRLFIIASLVSLFSACTEHHIESPAAFAKNEIKLPRIVMVQPPVVINLDGSRKPSRYRIPEKGVIHYTEQTQNGKRQRTIQPPETRPATFFVSMSKFSTDQGLLVPAVLSCYHDGHGNIWMGTQGGGVTRYDGKGMVTFTTNQFLGHNTIKAITEDSAGNIWFGLDGGGISKYDGRAISTLSAAQGLISNEVRDIQFDKNGILWVATREGASRYDGRSFINYTISEGLAANEVLCCAVDKSNNVWFGTMNGLSCYNGKSFINFTTADGLVNDVIVSIGEDSKGNLWFGGRFGGASKYDGRSFVNFADPRLGSIHCIKEDEAGTIWLGTYLSGLIGYDGTGTSNLTTAQGLADNIINSIAEDRSGNLWIAGMSGVNCYPGQAFISYSRVQGLPDNTVRNIIEDKKGNYWFATNSGGVCRYDGHEVTLFTMAQGLNHVRVHRVYEDRTGNLWFCTGDGVSVYDGKTITNFTTQNGLPNPAVRCIWQDKKGDFWFGTEFGLTKYDGRSFSNFSREQGLPYNNVRDIVEDESGNLWLGFSTRGGIVRYDGKTFINLDTAQGLAHSNVNALILDSKGNIWIGTGSHGVSILRKDMVKKFENVGDIKPGDKIFESFTTNEGLADDAVYDIAEDKQGNIIIGCNLGLTIIRGGIDPRQPISKEKIEYYNRKNGYPVNDVNTQALYVDNKGIIWAGTGDELVRFDYSAIHKSPIPPQVMIQNIKINNEKLGWYNLFSQHAKGRSALLPAIVVEEKVIYDKELTARERDSVQQKFSKINFDSITRFYPLPVNLSLPYSYNNITFDFAAIEPAKPQLVRYQYMLEGYDKDWSPASDKSTAGFGNIQEGEYTFKVKAMSPAGIWSEPVLYSFTVLPPYWRSWWFRLAYITAAAILVFLFIQWRIKAVRKNEQKKVAHEKELLELEARALRAQMNPHFIFNCLNSIKALIQTDDKIRSIEYLTTFSKLIRTLFHNSDKRQITLYDEIETCKLYAQLETMRLSGKLKYKFDIDPNLDLKSVMVPALIVQPFIENAIWHGIVPKDEGTINITVTGDENKIICEVDDDGIGREMSKRNKPITPVMHESKGIHLSQARLHLERMLNDTDASLQTIDKYEQNVATGTKIVLTFNLR